MRRRLRYGLSAFLLAVAATFSTGLFGLNMTAAEEAEADVNFTVVNDPAEVTGKGPAQEEVIPAGEDLTSTTITYKNAKSITVVLKDPDGNVLGTKTADVEFSPDAQEIVLNWESGLLSKHGQYTIEITATGTDGKVVSAESIVFYYGEKTVGLPNTGTMTVLGAKVPKQPMAIGAVVTFALVGLAAIVFIARKGAVND